MNCEYCKSPKMKTCYGTNGKAGQGKWYCCECLVWKWTLDPVQIRDGFPEICDDAALETYWKFRNKK